VAAKALTFTSLTLASTLITSSLKVVQPGERLSHRMTSMRMEMATDLTVPAPLLPASTASPRRLISLLSKFLARMVAGPCPTLLAASAGQRPRPR
jgi:hypothetical protein